MQKRKRLLIVDDDPLFAETLAKTLRGLLPQVKIDATYSVAALEAIIENITVDAVILDLSLDPRLGVESGFRALHMLVNLLEDTRVIILTSHGAEDYGIQAVEIGASSFIEKPGCPQQIAALVLDAIRQKEFLQAARRGRISLVEWLSEQIVGETQALCNLRQQILFAAKSKEPVHIFGEVGTGKTLVARLIDHLGLVGSKRILNINCSDEKIDFVKLLATLSNEPSTTREAAEAARYFDLSHYSQIVFQNTHHLSAALRASLLVTIKDSLLYTSAGLSISDFRPRVVFTYQLERQSQSSSFGIYPEVQAVSGLIIFLPPLSAYGEDLALLCVHLLDHINDELSLRIERVSETALNKLDTMQWFANIRELKEVLKMAALSASQRESLQIGSQDLSFVQM